ncbi:MAG: VOC family protein [Planctomycetes bacterium]|nr:VOC family protein [Planctomycetota bacterium]MBM4085192.1 VOC family protein [Planctomycetota bacterium]
MRDFDHVGVPTEAKQAGEVYVADTKVWVTSPTANPHKIEWLRFEPDSPVKGPVRDLPHFAFRVPSVKAAIKGEKVILGPFDPMPGLTVVFIMKDGAVFEFMEYKEAKKSPKKAKRAKK